MDDDEVGRMVRAATQDGYRAKRESSLFGVKRSDVPKILIPLILAGVTGYFGTKYLVATNADAIKRNAESAYTTRVDVRALELRANALDVRIKLVEFRQDQSETLQAIGETLIEIRDALTGPRRKRR